MRILRSALMTLSALAVMQSPVLAQTPQELGWEAGVVAPSPLRPIWENKPLSTMSVAEKARAAAREELERVKKLRSAQKALCQEKIFVNACLNKAEEVLRDRQRFAAQLLRTADKEIRGFKIAEKVDKPQPSRLMPKKKAEAQTITDEDLKAEGKRVTERARQELANERAFEEKQKAQDERRERLKAEAEKRKARREARRAEQEAKKKAQEAAQAHQDQQKNKSSVFF